MLVSRHRVPDANQSAAQEPEHAAVFTPLLSHFTVWRWTAGPVVSTYPRARLLAGRHIDVDAVRPELQQGLLEWQDTLIHAAHELFFGETEAVSTISEQDLAVRLNDALFEIRRLKTIVKLHSRRLGTLERFTLPDTYFDTLEDEDS